MEHLSDMQQGLVMAIRFLMADAEGEQVSGEVLRAQIADLYPSTVFQSPDMMKQPLIPQTLHAWLRTHDVHLRETKDMRSSDRLRSPAAGGLWELRSGLRTNAADKTDTTVAHRISLRFKNESSRFSGDACDFLNEYAADYELICEDYELSANQMLRFFYNLLRGDAERIYLNELVHTVDTYELMVARIRNEYQSDVRQSQARNKLASLRMKAFEAKGMSFEKALTSTYEEVLTGSKLLSPSHSGEVFRVEYPRDAMVGFE
eukprot:contig_943_g102